MQRTVDLSIIYQCKHLPDEIDKHLMPNLSEHLPLNEKAIDAWLNQFKSGKIVL
jgi:hypothetical protein